MKKFIVLFSVVLAVFAFSGTSFAGSSAAASQGQSQSNVNGGVGSSIVSTATTQGQRQAQGQTAIGLGGSGGASNSSIGIGEKAFSPAASFEIKDAFNGSINRQFPIPGQIIYPIAPAYFGAPTPGNQFIPLAKLAQYTTEWKLERIKHILNDKGWGGIDAEIRAYVDRDSVQNLADSIIVTATQPKDYVSIEEVGLADVAVTNNSNLSIDAFAKVLEEAQALADVTPSVEGNEVKVVVQFLAEGVLRKMHATGWGIGVSFTGATMSTGQKLGTMSTGGTGWSTGTSGYIDRPWLQALILKVEVPAGTKLAFKAPVTPRDPGIEKKMSELSNRLNAIETSQNVDNAVKATVATPNQ
jgi:hypothetical protein